MSAPFQPVPHHLKTADLLLINPDFSKSELGVASPPENHVGLNRIAGWLAERGHTSQVLDTTGCEVSRTGPEELADWLVANASRYRMIGFHVNSWNINHILRILDRARGILKSKKLIFGGPLPSSEPQKMMELLMAQNLGDVALVQGMGEKILVEILEKNRFTGIDGLWAFENGQFQTGGKIALTGEEYAQSPFLSLAHNTFYQNYYKPVLESGDLGEFGMELIFSSQGLDLNRGCPFNCTYCSVPQYESKMVAFSPKRVADELEYLAREAGFFMFTFTNSNILFLHAEWIREFCRELIGRGMHNYINWTAYHHPSIASGLDVSDFNLIRKSGSDTIVFGVQSFEEKILKLFMRPLNTPEITEIIREKSKKAKLELTVDYITGVPGEDLDVVEQAFHYFAENNVECRNYQLKLYPNTKLQTLGLDLTHHDLVPITGNLAPELEAYAIVPKDPNPRAAMLDAFIREANATLIKNRPVRMGKYLIRNPEQARELLENEIPNNPDIPDRVKGSMSLALREMLKPKKRAQTLNDLDPAAMMRLVVLASPDAPPMLLAMQAKLRREMGEGKFAQLKARYESDHA
ncbi:B12-binding domain-containing radical SAM protein [Candidatus Peregrinibacteria bacterium]|nr:B12-binding domain-containing radical SAM protein [Candidatus Peregrinibacteria bacterium]